MSNYKELGLSSKEAETRLKRDGLNELSSAKPKTLVQLILATLSEPMLLLLIACGSIYFLLGDYSEGLLMIFFVSIISTISVIQETKTEKSLEALKNLSSPIAKVFRDSKIVSIPGREVVLGDVVVVNEGDRIPADGLLVQSNNLAVDESLLTGESLAVNKISANLPKLNEYPDLEKPGGDNTYSVFSGTLVTRGQGVAVIKAIGGQTAMGQIGKSLESVKQEKTLLQTEVKNVVRNFAIAGIVMCALLIVLYGIQYGEWIAAVLAGITLAMGTLPEEFPLVLTIFMTMGAWRLSRKKVLSRRAATIETLGSATVLCVDKTGTLTQNKMSIAKYFIPEEGSKLPDEDLSNNYKELIRVGTLACELEPFDPMELAFYEMAKKYFGKIEDLRKDMKLIKEYDLEQDLFSVTHVWQNRDFEIEVCAKGAPEAIFKLCKLDEKIIDDYKRGISEMAVKGLRVLAIAGGKQKNLKVENLPEKRDGIDYNLLGFVGFADPVRPEIKNAIKLCYSAGIRVVMITGDYPITAINIAKQIGLESEGGVLTGEEIESMSMIELNQKIKNVNIYSRVVPSQKLLLVKALKSQGEVVAMTGDGVNDAPALKSAHIGIAMGKRGTDVAREASSMVLIDDNFASIVDGVKIGRRIYANLRKAMTYIFAVHIPIAGLSLIPVFFKWPLLLFPAHILLLEMVIDPACTVAFEAERAEPDSMKNPPRSLKEPLFNRKMIIISLLQGLIVLFVLAGLYSIFLNFGVLEDRARALVFMVMIASNIALIWTNRSWSQMIIHRTKESNNRPAIMITLITLLILLMVNYVPFLTGLFKFEQLSFIELVITIIGGFSLVLWFELLKVFKLVH